MQFSTTRNNDRLAGGPAAHNAAAGGSPVSFRDAVLRCLPPDGGLFVPSDVMDLRQFFPSMSECTGYPELVSMLAPALLQGELNLFSAARVAESAFDFEPELTQLDDNFSVLKLYNGPTGTFMDFGVAFLAAVMEEFLKNERQAMILSAARGDNGTILDRAFRHRKGLTSVLLYPAGSIHGLDPAFFVPNGGNTIPIRINGTLDDCQRLVRETILDRVYAERYNITSANTINAGRLLPQSFYFLYAFIKMKKKLSGDLYFSIPSGNFGNLISGLYAWKFGLPVNGFIAAMNANNAFGEFIQGGKFVKKPVISTNSPALDVGYPANYERLQSFYDEAPAVMRNMIFPASTDNAETVKSIEQAWKQYGIALDPQGAVAFSAARDFIRRDNSSNAHVIVLATGHPAREAELFGAVTGQNLVVPEKFAMLRKEIDPIAVIDPQLDALEGAIASCF